MKKVFTEAATRLDIPSIEKWKEDGGRVIGYTCSFIPVELFYAAGILPVRLRLFAILPNYYEIFTANSCFETVTQNKKRIICGQIHQNWQNFVHLQNANKIFAFCES